MAEKSGYAPGIVPEGFDRQRCRIGRADKEMRRRVRRCVAFGTEVVLHLPNSKLIISESGAKPGTQLGEGCPNYARQRHLAVIDLRRWSVQNSASAQPIDGFGDDVGVDGGLDARVITRFDLPIFI